MTLTENVDQGQDPELTCSRSLDHQTTRGPPIMVRQAPGTATDHPPWRESS